MIGVCAAAGVDVGGLDGAEIHRDVADVAEQVHVRAVGREFHVLGHVGAVEHQRVVAGAAVDGVAAVSRIPGEAVIAGTKRRRVATATSVDLIVTGPPDEHVITVTTAQDIITRTPIEGQRGEACQTVAPRDRVGPGEPLYVETLDRGGLGRRRCRRRGTDVRAVRSDVDRVRTRSAQVVHGVDPRPAVDGDCGRSSEGRAAVDGVVAGEGVDVECVVGGFGAGDLDLGGQAGHEDVAWCRAESDVVGVVGPVDDDGVGLPVAGAAGRRAEIDVRWCAGPCR